MAANWQKILFSGSAIEIGSISASNVPTITDTSPELQIVTIGASNNQLRTISQSNLSVQEGSVNFTIQGSGPGSIASTTFNGASDTLIFTSSDASYLTVSHSFDAGGNNTSSISINLAANYITGSAQLNAINYSYISSNTLPAGAPHDWNTAFGNLFINTTGLTGGAHHSITYNSNQLGSGSAYSSLPNGAGTLFNHLQNHPDHNTSTVNLWKNRLSVVNPNNINSNLDPDAAQGGRRSYAWLSASLVGGFIADGSLGSSASYSDFSESVIHNSESLAAISGNIHTINEQTSSMALNAHTSSFLLQNKIISKEVESIFFGTDVAQVTIVDNPNAAQIQGKKIGLPTNLTVSGSVTARTLNLSGDPLQNQGGIELQEVVVSAFNGNINYGTSSLHSHGFQGIVNITGGLDVTGSVSIAAALDDSNFEGADVPPELLISKGAPSFDIGVTQLSGSNTSLNNQIVTTANSVSESFATLLDNISTSVGTGADDADNIDDLQTGYAQLSTTYSQSFYFGTASSDDEALSGLIVGNHLAIGNSAGTASFSGSATTGSNLLSAGFSSTATVATVKQIFNTQSFIDLTGVFTGSGEISSSVSGLNRYVLDSDGVITGSNNPNVDINVAYTEGNVEYIANLAANLPGGSGETFLRGSNLTNGGPVFNGAESTNFPNLVNDTNSVTQGVLEFLSGSTVMFGASGSDVSITGSPTFNSLTAANLLVSGTLTTVQTTNLNVKDQFILVNSGAKAGGDANIANVNDKDGGIIIAQNTTSGSLFLYDSSHASWGFIGASGSNQKGLDVESHYQQTLTPEATIRTILYKPDVEPVAISTSNYGDSSVFTELGTMYISTAQNEEDVYIYA